MTNGGMSGLHDDPQHRRDPSPAEPVGSGKPFVGLQPRYPRGAVSSYRLNIGSAFDSSPPQDYRSCAGYFGSLIPACIGIAVHHVGSDDASSSKVAGSRGPI